MIKVFLFPSPVLFSQRGHLSEIILTEGGVTGPSHAWSTLLSSESVKPQAMFNSTFLLCGTVFLYTSLDVHCSNRLTELGRALELVRVSIPRFIYWTNEQFGLIIVLRLDESWSLAVRLCTSGIQTPIVRMAVSSESSVGSNYMVGRWYSAGCWKPQPLTLYLPQILAGLLSSSEAAERWKIPSCRGWIIQ